MSTDWSCDFKFEKALYDIGFKTREDHLYFGGKFSSYSRVRKLFFKDSVALLTLLDLYSQGCANDFIPDFHILTESKTIPRWQCGICTRLSGIETSGHWDGPLGGGNSPWRAGLMDSWFFNHKSEFLFYEAYLNSSNCVRLDNFVPLCNTSRNGLSYESVQKHSFRFATISLADGYGFDFVRETYCRFTQPSVLKHQVL